MSCACLLLFCSFCTVYAEEGTKYECEAEGNEFISPCGPFGDGTIEGASGGIMVGHTGGDGQYYFVMNNIQAEKTGVYRVEIFYACADISRTFRIGVNGKEGDLIELEEASDTFEANPISMEVELELEAGSNSLKFYTVTRDEGEGDHEWAPNFDCIIIHELLPEETTTHIVDAEKSPTLNPTEENIEVSATAQNSIQPAETAEPETGNDGNIDIIVVSIAIVAVAVIVVIVLIINKKRK